MDDEGLDASRHTDALRGLRRINALSFTAQTFWPPLLEFSKKSPRPIKVLDIATGGGDVPIALAQLAQRHQSTISFAACDKSDVALEFARERSRQLNTQIEFFKLDVLADPLPDGFDVVVNSLFLHHFDPNDVVKILARMARTQLVLVSDLRRSRSGLVLAHVATRLLSRSPVVHVDGPRSVRAAYTLPEMRQMLEKAGMANARIENRWPCRMLLQWSRPPHS